MNNAIFNFHEPKNEPILGYIKNSPERLALEKELEKQASHTIDIPLIIGGKEIRTGKTGKVVMPHDHGHILAHYHMATEKEIQMAVDAALNAKNDWMNISWVERASIMLKAAGLISGKYRFQSTSFPPGRGISIRFPEGLFPRVFVQ